jgi:hypothetical protein
MAQVQFNLTFVKSFLRRPLVRRTPLWDLEHKAMQTLRAESPAVRWMHSYAALEFVGVALGCRIHANAFVMSSTAGRGHAS